MKNKRKNSTVVESWIDIKTLAIIHRVLNEKYSHFDNSKSGIVRSALTILATKFEQTFPELAFTSSQDAFEYLKSYGLIQKSRHSKAAKSLAESIDLEIDNNTESEVQDVINMLNTEDKKDG